MFVEVGNDDVRRQSHLPQSVGGRRGGDRDVGLSDTIDLRKQRGTGGRDRYGLPGEGVLRGLVRVIVR